VDSDYLFDNCLQLPVFLNLPLARAAGATVSRPYTYLRDVLTRLPAMTNRQIKDIVPKAWAASLSSFRFKNFPRKRCLFCGYSISSSSRSESAYAPTQRAISRW